VIQAKLLERVPAKLKHFSDNNTQRISMAEVERIQINPTSVIPGKRRQPRRSGIQ
jgi:hypothetical protein